MKFALNTRINDILLGFQKFFEPSSLNHDLGFSTVEPLIKKTISPKDALYPVYKKDHAERNYFVSGVRQVASFDGLLNRYTGKRLAECRSIVDFACHYGRVLRCLRAALPSCKLYACDIDREAVDFCVSEFDCLPLYGSWKVEDMIIAEPHDFIFCISLLTHTRREYFSRVIGRWQEMLSPGGLLLFTFLGEEFTDKCIAGDLDHYVSTPISGSVIREKIAEFHKSGHTFCDYQTPYSDAGEYGIGFLSKDVIQQEIDKNSGLRLQALVSGLKNDFAQDLAVVLKV